MAWQAPQPHAAHVRVRLSPAGTSIRIWATPSSVWQAKPTAPTLLGMLQLFTALQCWLVRSSHSSLATCVCLHWVDHSCCCRFDQGTFRETRDGRGLSDWLSSVPPKIVAQVMCTALHSHARALCLRPLHVGCHQVTQALST